jgi:signal transduction histidine kinase
MKNILIFFSVLILSSITLNAQNPQIDSLKADIEKYKSKDSIRIDLLNETANKLYFSETENAIEYAKEAEEIAIDIGYLKGRARSLSILGLCYDVQVNYKMAIDHLNMSLKINQEINNDLETINCFLNIGNIFFKQGKYTQAREYYQYSFTNANETGDKQGEAINLNNIGLTYINQGIYTQALTYFQKSLAIVEEIGDKAIIADCLGNIGVIFYDMEDYTKAFEYYKRSLKIFEELKQYAGISNAFNNLALIHEKQNKLDSALLFYNRSINITKENNLPRILAWAYNGKGIVYLKQKKYDNALEAFLQGLRERESIYEDIGISQSYVSIGKLYLEIHQFNKAQEYLLKGYEISDEIDNLKNQRDAAEGLSMAYEQTNQYAKSLKFFKIFKSLNDSILNEEAIKKITVIEYQYKFDQEKQIIAMEQQRKDALHDEKDKQQKTIIVAFIISFILMIGLVFVVLRSFIQKRTANLILTKQKEEIQTTASELEKANKTKDKFFSIIAHDLKSPFNSLLGFSELLLENHKEYDENERESYLKIINEVAKNTYELLETLLTWARSQTDRLKFNPEKINIEALIYEIIFLLKETAKNKEIEILSKVDKEIVIYADKNMISTVIRNLISNAIKFTPVRGKITVVVYISNDNENVQVSVKDTGVGIPPETQSKLFKITETVTTKGTENESGTGLGLILCKDFIEKHGGRIWVESVPTKGSEFLFTIPFTSQDNIA